MDAVKLNLYEFLREHPGIWSNRELAARMECSVSTVIRELTALRRRGVLETKTERKRLNGWWVRREIRIKERP